MIGRWAGFCATQLLAAASAYAASPIDNQACVRFAPATAAAISHIGSGRMVRTRAQPAN